MTIESYFDRKIQSHRQAWKEDWRLESEFREKN